MHSQFRSKEVKLPIGSAEAMTIARNEVWVSNDKSNDICIYDVASRALVHTLKAHSTVVCALCAVRAPLASDATTTPSTTTVTATAVNANEQSGARTLTSSAAKHTPQSAPRGASLALDAASVSRGGGGSGGGGGGGSGGGVGVGSGASKATFVDDAAHAVPLMVWSSSLCGSICVWNAETRTLCYQMTPDEARRTPVHSLVQVGDTIWAASGRIVYVYSVARVLARYARQQRAVVASGAASGSGAAASAATVDNNNNNNNNNDDDDDARRNTHDDFLLRSFRVEQVDANSGVGGSVAVTRPQSTAITALCCTGAHVWCAMGAHVLVYEAAPSRYVQRVLSPRTPSSAARHADNDDGDDGNDNVTGGGGGYDGERHASSTTPVKVYSKVNNEAADDTLEHALLKVVIGHSASVQTMLYSKEFDVVWSGDTSGALFVWGAQEFECIRAIDGAHHGALHSLIEVELVLNEQFLREVWSGAEDACVRIWDAESFHCLNELSAASDAPVRAMLAVGNNRVWSGGRGCIYVWDHARLTTALSLEIIPYESGDKYVGEVALIEGGDGAPVRHGHGELHYANGDKYVGYWKKDRKNGYGVMMYSNMDKYYGYWRRNDRQGWGVVVYADGTVFEGLWMRSARKGLGTVTFPNGDSIRGDWNDDEVSKAVFTKGSLETAAVCSIKLYEATLDAAKAKAEHAATRRRKKPSVIKANKWSSLSRLPVPLLRRGVAQRFGDGPHSPNVLSMVLSDAMNPIGKSLADFVFSFKASYHFSYGNVQRLLHSAIDDVHSFSARLHEIVLKIFNIAPKKRVECFAVLREIILSKVYQTLFDLFRVVTKNNDSVVAVKFDSLRHITVKEIGIKPEFWLIEDAEEINRDLDRMQAGNSAGDSGGGNSGTPLLAHRLHGSGGSKSRTHSRASTPVHGASSLQESHTSDDGAASSSTSAVAVAAAHTNAAAAAAAAASANGAQLANIIDPLIGHEAYTRAINELRLISRYKTISRKLKVLISVSRAILNAVDEFYSGEREDESILLGTEDKFPILSYVLIKANVPHIYSEVAFIRTFGDAKELREEAEYRLTEIETALEYVSTLDWNVVDESGVLLPLKFVERRTVQAIEDATQRFEDECGFPPRKLWVAELLMLCGSQRSGVPTYIDLSPDEFEFVSMLLNGYDADAYVSFGQHALGTLGLVLERVPYANYDDDNDNDNDDTVNEDVVDGEDNEAAKIAYSDDNENVAVDGAVENEVKKCVEKNAENEAKASRAPAAAEVDEFAQTSENAKDDAASNGGDEDAHKSTGSGSSSRAEAGNDGGDDDANDSGSLPSPRANTHLDATTHDAANDQTASNDDKSGGGSEGKRKDDGGNAEDDDDDDDDDEYEYEDASVEDDDDDDEAHGDVIDDVDGEGDGVVNGDNGNGDGALAPTAVVQKARKPVTLRGMKKGMKKRVRKGVQKFESAVDAARRRNSDVRTSSPSPPASAGTSSATGAVSSSKAITARTAPLPAAASSSSSTKGNLRNSLMISKKRQANQAMWQSTTLGAVTAWDSNDDDNDGSGGGGASTSTAPQPRVIPKRKSWFVGKRALRRGAVLGAGASGGERSVGNVDTRTAEALRIPSQVDIAASATAVQVGAGANASASASALRDWARSSAPVARDGGNSGGGGGGGNGASSGPLSSAPATTATGTSFDGTISGVNVESLNTSELESYIESLKSDIAENREHMKKLAEAYRFEDCLELKHQVIVLEERLTDAERERDERAASPTPTSHNAKRAQSGDNVEVDGDAQRQRQLALDDEAAEEAARMVRAQRPPFHGVLRITFAHPYPLYVYAHVSHQIYNTYI